jgi:hypothetical protein
MNNFPDNHKKGNLFIHTLLFALCIFVVWLARNNFCNILYQPPSKTLLRALFIIFP